MDRTLIVCASHTGVRLRTQACMEELQRHGARLLTVTGIADVALARNAVLTAALNAKTGADVFLLVDDDMVWQLAAAAKVVGLARSTGEAWSAAYTTQDGHLAATPLEWNDQRADGLRMVGLGFCAVPVAKLEALAKELGTVLGSVNSEERVVPFCECRVVVPAHDNIARWCSEDYWLCRALGGVRLAPHVSVGHLKLIDLWPDAETVNKIAEGLPLATEPPQVGGKPAEAATQSEPPPPSSSPPGPPAPTNPETPAAKNKKKGKKRNGTAETAA